jgi:UDP-N-acetylglucosamine 4,6-dehydratase
MRVIDLATTIAPDAKVNIVGIRPGEKLHEVLISEDEARTTVELDDMFVVQPAEANWFGHAWEMQGKPLQDGFRYVSDTNPDWMTIEQIQKMVAPFEVAFVQGKEL